MPVARVSVRGQQPGPAKNGVLQLIVRIEFAPPPHSEKGLIYVRHVVLRTRQKHKNDSNVRHALCSSDIRTLANTLQDQKTPTLRRNVKEGTPMKNNGQVKNIDGISNTTSSRRGALDWDIMSATHCLTVAPRHFWLPIYHLSRRPNMHNFGE